MIKNVVVAVSIVLASIGVLLAPAGATVTMPPGTISLPTTGSFLYFNSEAGDFIGQGQETLWSGESVTFETPLVDRDLGMVDVQVSYPGGSWYLRFNTETASPFVVGSYTNAHRDRPPGYNFPTMSVSGNGRGCNSLTGQFDVNEVSFAYQSRVLVFDVTFEQHCNEFVPALFGRIRVEFPAPPPDTTPPTLYLPTSTITAEATSPAGAVVDYPFDASDDRDVDPQVSCSPTSGAVFPIGTTAVSCFASDESGNTASGSFNIVVEPPLVASAAIAGQSNAQHGTPTIEGTVSCSAVASFFVTGTVSQRQGTTTISGTFSAFGQCVGTNTHWQSTVQSKTGNFRAGPAQVNITGDMCRLSCPLISAQRNIVLVARP